LEVLSRFNEKQYGRHHTASRHICATPNQNPDVRRPSKNTPPVRDQVRLAMMSPSHLSSDGMPTLDTISAS